MRVTGFPAISKSNADLLIETGLVSARSTSSPPTVTSNASFASTEFVSSIPSKVMVSVSPSTNADENAAGVMLAAEASNVSTRLPDNRL